MKCGTTNLIEFVWEIWGRSRTDTRQAPFEPHFVSCTIRFPFSRLRGEIRADGYGRCLHLDRVRRRGPNRQQNQYLTLQWDTKTAGCFM